MFSLTSVFVPQKRQNLASFISVDADAGHDGLRQDPDPAAARATPRCPGPSQIANDVRRGRATSRTSCCRSRRANAKALYGNLLTLPVGDGLLYVQPLYTQRSRVEGALPDAAVRAGVLRRATSASAPR